MLLVNPLHYIPFHSITLNPYYLYNTLYHTVPLWKMPAVIPYPILLYILYISVVLNRAGQPAWRLVSILVSVESRIFLCDLRPGCNQCSNHSRSNRHDAVMQEMVEVVSRLFRNVLTHPVGPPCRGLPGVSRLPAKTTDPRGFTCEQNHFLNTHFASKAVLTIRGISGPTTGALS